MCLMLALKYIACCLRALSTKRLTLLAVKVSSERNADVQCSLHISHSNSGITSKHNTVIIFASLSRITYPYLLIVICTCAVLPLNRVKQKDIFAVSDDR